MMASLVGLAGTALPLLGAIVIGIMVLVYRRGGALATGIIGAVLLLIGLILPPILLIAGLMSDPTAFTRGGPYSGGLRKFVLEGIPGILMGLGVILVVIASVMGRRER